jgi:DNA-binding PadR family transcriptional regulator
MGDKSGSLKHNRKAKLYELTKAGHRTMKRTAAEWRQTQDIVARFLEPVND